MEVLGGAQKDPTEPLPLLLEWQPHRSGHQLAQETPFVSENHGEMRDGKADGAQVLDYFVHK